MQRIPGISLTQGGVSSILLNVTYLGKRTVKHGRDGVYILLPKSWIEQNYAKDGDYIEMYDASFTDEGAGSLLVKHIPLSSKGDQDNADRA